MAEGADAYAKLVQGGFSQQEADAWRRQQTQKLVDGGFSPKDIDAYWGETTPSSKPLAGHMDANYSQLGPEDHQKIASNPLEALAAGWDMSVTSLALRGAPKTVLPQHAGVLADVLSQVGMLAGDIPAAVAGFVGGASAGAAAGAAVPVAGETGASEAAGAVLGAGAGSAALPEAMRETLLEYQRQDKRWTWKELLQTSSHIAWNTLKAGVAGAAGAGAGGAVTGRLAAAGATPFVSSTAGAAAFAGTTVTAASAMDGKVPESQDFIAGAALMLGMHIAGEGVGKALKLPAQGEQVEKNLQDIYAKTGVPPWEAVQRAQKDAAFKSEILAPHNPDGSSNHPAFDADRPAEPPPYKTNAFKIQQEHEDEISRIHTEAFDIEGHLDLLRRLEGSGDMAVSPKGAVGRYQIMPDTARQYGFDPARLGDPEYNKRVATTVAKDLARQFPGDTEAQLIAYNAGPGRARRFIASGRDYSKLPLETQRYLEHAERLGALNSDLRGQTVDKQLALTGDSGGWEPPPGEPPKPEAEVEPPEPGAPKLKPGYQLSEESLQSKILDIVAPEAKESGIPPWMNPRRWLAEFQSRLTPLVRIDDRLKKEGILEPGGLGLEDLARQTFAAKERAGYFTRFGTLDPVTLEKTSDASRVAAYKAVKEDGGTAAGFTAYRLAKRTIEKADQGIQTGIDVDEAKRFVGLTAKKYERGAGVMRQVTDAQVDYGIGSGLFSKAMGEATKAANQEHIVMRRVIDPEYKPAVVGKGGFRVRNPLKRMLGSERQIVDPETADLDNAHTIIAMADHNRFVGSVIGAIEAKNSQLGKYLGLEKLEGLSHDELGRVLKTEILDENGKPIPPEAKEAMAPFLAARALGDKAKSAKDTFVYYRNGVPELWKATDPDIADILRMQWPGRSNPIVELMTKFAGLSRAGITGALSYPIRVIIHGQLASSALGEKTAAPFHDMMSGVMSVVKQDENYQRWVAKGGGSSALADMDVNYLQKDLQRVFEETGTNSRVWNVVRHPIQSLRAFQHGLDAASRVGYMTRLEKQGFDSLKAATMSRAAYLDFAEGFSASWVNTWARMVPFMPSGFKDIEQVGRAFKERPIQTALKASAILTLPTVVNYAVNHLADQSLPDGQKYSDQPQWARDMYWIMPPVNGVRIKIPKPYVVGFMFGTFPERFLDWTAGQNPHAFAEWAKTLVAQVVPPLTPIAVTPIAEQWTNKSFFTDRPLIKASLEKASGYMQYTPETTETAKRISAVLGAPGLNIADVSPIILEEYARQWGGTMPFTLAKAMEMPFRDAPHPWTVADIPFVQSFIARNPGMGAQPIQDFYEAMDKIDEAHANLRLAIERQDFSEVQNAMQDVRAYMNLSALKKALHTQAQFVDAINRDKNMTNDEKLARIDQVYGNMVTFAKAGLQMADTIGKEQ